jgi:hypothetical protein
MKGIETWKSDFKFYITYTDSDGKVWEGEIILGSGRRGSMAYKYVSDVVWEGEEYPDNYEDIETELDKEFDKYIVNAEHI